MRAFTPPACHLVRSGRNPDVRLFTGGLPISEKESRTQKMSISSSANGYPLDPTVGMSDCRITRATSEEYSHEPVMLEEVIELFDRIPSGVFIDATIGGAGHAKALLENREDLHLVGIDQDLDAITAATSVLSHLDGRFDLVHERFDHITTILARLGVERISGALFDLGVSSHQLNTPSRGFSFRNHGPLDMRMNRAIGTKAEDLINTSDASELSRILNEYGDERYHRRVAQAIVDARPLHTTTALRDVIVDAMPASSKKFPGHPARRTFQAIRIAVNNEIEILESALMQVVSHLAVGGRCAVLAYHSGEDRIVKRTIRKAAGLNAIVPKHLPEPPEKPLITLLARRGRTPSRNELERNPRSSSARLRSFEKTREN